ncbi:hypothetical protein [Allokutzneria albata]|uniref:Uncharacterized protein n=1 Tax=Allokutzneria albata TaxID=211114 RepID=A0A1G9S7C8_ALLAB|nr:hypothetical protein [Allokutzneria albata]SDM31321.1 hypothetical protein SAMN04489726_0939 [Allokutzneria albata]
MGRVSTALLVASTQSTKVTKGLQAVRALANTTAVDVTVETGLLADLPGLLRRQVDLLVFDGHGYFPPRVGRLPITPEAIRGPDNGGLRAPVVVLGCCWGGTHDFRKAVRRCLDAPTVFLGHTGEAPFEHAELVFPPVIDMLADVEPAPFAIRARIEAILRGLGPEAAGWTVAVLRPS